MQSPGPRVLHIITRLDPGGSATNTIVSVDLLRKHGFNTALAYGPTTDPAGRIAAGLAEKGITSFPLPHLVRTPAPVTDLRALTEIGRLLGSDSFDIVHTHSSKAGILGRLAAARAGIPCVHTPHGHIFYGYFGSSLTLAFVLLERWMARRTRKLVSLTDIETGECLARKIGAREQYVTIHSGVPLAGFRRIPGEAGAAFRRAHKIPAHSVLFVSVGRLVPVKGFDILLRAFSAADFGDADVRLAIVGDGAERPALERIGRAAGAGGRVIFTGPMDDVCGALSAADAFVLASRNEGMGRALIEAMAAGLPVIATAVGGIPAVVADGRNGILVPPEATHPLARAMEQLAADPELRRRLGAHGAESVYPEYDQDTMIQQLAALYREVLS